MTYLKVYNNYCDAVQIAGSDVKEPVVSFFLANFYFLASPGGVEGSHENSRVVAVVAWIKVGHYSTISPRLYRLNRIGHWRIK